MLDDLAAAATKDKIPWILPNGERLKTKDMFAIDLSELSMYKLMIKSKTARPISGTKTVQIVKTKRGGFDNVYRIYLKQVMMRRKEKVTMAKDVQMLRRSI